MILVDTSVVIDYIRSADAKLLSLFGQHGAAICGITRAEVLHGTRNPGHGQRLVAALNSFGQLAIAEPIWDITGANLAALRTSGITVPFADVVIATVAIAYGIELWARDRQFLLIQGVLSQLRLFQEPP